MSIGSVSSSATPYSTSNTQRPQNQDLMNLGKALQSGNLTAAQSAFASFQQNLPGTSSVGPFSSTGTLGTDVKSLQSALQSGDVSEAQQAFSKLTTDLRSMHPAHAAHHRQTISASASSAMTTSSDPTATTTSASDATTSSDPITNLVKFLSNSIGTMVNQQA